MGLDITAYSKMVPADLPLYKNSDVDYDTLYDNGMVSVYRDHFPLSSPTLEGVRALAPTAQTQTYSWHAGSYGGYNRFREVIASLAGFISPRAVWENPDRFIDWPFFELVNFSDCDGTIDSLVSKKLLQNFIDFRAEALRMDRDWMYLYDEWIGGLSVAADDGVLDFH